MPKTGVTGPFPAMDHLFTVSPIWVEIILLQSPWVDNEPARKTSDRCLESNQGLWLAGPLC